MRNESMETALKMIEMHLGILLAKEEVVNEVEDTQKRKKRTQKFGNELAKMDGKLSGNKKGEAKEDTIRLYTDLMKKEKRDA